MSAPPLGVFWGLRRLADDGGRFMLADLRGAGPEVLADLLTGLAPFTTGIVLTAEPGRMVWRRAATPLFGRIEEAVDAEAVAAAKRSGADAVLAGATLAEATGTAEIARLGDDAAADLALAARPSGPWLVVTDGDARVPDDPAPGLVGFLLRASFWRAASATADADARRRVIADELVPRVQALNARTADLPPGAWRHG